MNDEKNMTSAQNAQPKEWKKILKIVGNVFLWLFVAFALVVTILAFAAQRNSDGIPSVGGRSYLTVQSESMSPLINKGDLIIVRKISLEKPPVLKVDDIISYRGVDKNLNGEIDETDPEEVNAINTHRIVSIEYDDNGNVSAYFTQGDNRKVSMVPERIELKRVVAKYTGTRIPGLGGFLGFLQKPTGFLVIIVLPLVLFFGYEVFVFIKTLLSIKNSGKKVISSADEELIKQRAVEEYLRQQAAAKAAEEADQAQEQQEQPPEEPKE